MAYIQNPKSPVAKALKGNQHRLPQHLQDAIKAAPETPAKQTAKPADLPKRNIKKEKEQKERDDVRIQTRMARDEFHKALKNKVATEKRTKGQKNSDARVARANAAAEVARTRHNERVAHKGGEGLGTGEYKMRTLKRKKGELPKPKGASALKSAAKKYKK